MLHGPRNRVAKLPVKKHNGTRGRGVALPGPVGLILLLARLANRHARGRDFASREADADSALNADALKTQIRLAGLDCFVLFEEVAADFVLLVHGFIIPYCGPVSNGILENSAGVTAVATVLSFSVRLERFAEPVGNFAVVLTTLRELRGTAVGDDCFVFHTVEYHGEREKQTLLGFSFGKFGRPSGRPERPRAGPTSKPRS